MTTSKRGWRLEWGESQAESAEVLTIAELDSILDRLTIEATRSMPFIVILTLPDESSMLMGVGRPVTILGFATAPAGSDQSPTMHSFGGGPPNSDPLGFSYMGHWSEFPPESGVSVEAARDAMREFFRTGALWRGIVWEED